MKILDVMGTELTNLPEFPDSLEILNCNYNQLKFLPKLPNLLGELRCSNNQLTSLAEVQIPNSLNKLYCYNNKLTSLPDFSHIDHELDLSICQKEIINYISYNTNLKLNIIFTNKINIEGYPYNPITNQKELDKYMEYQLYKINRIKSARK